MSVSDKVVTGASGVGLFSWATNRLYGRLTDAAYNKYAKVYKPAGIVSIIVPAFNEEEYIEKTLKSILSQNIILECPDYFECIVVDNESTDRTAEIAKQYCQVIFAPRGKLNARHKGILEASGDIIVACDADCYYPPNWLNLLLRPFHDQEVIAVHGNLLYPGNFLDKLFRVWTINLLPFAYSKIMSGANAAFKKDIYFKVGGFDLSINQSDIEEMLIEEEIVFLGKLKHFGKVIFNIQAICFAATRSGGRKALIEQRLAQSKYQQEVARGERF